MHIVPQKLCRIRNERQLSRQELASKSKVSLKQIQRLEDPKQASTNVRPLTLRRLATALEVEQEELTGEPPMPDDPKTVRIGAALEPGVRLAYELIEQRYGVSTWHLINMAPLYFALLAEGNLAWRREELAESRTAIDRAQELADSPRKRFTRHAFRASEDSSYEEQAIERGDLFNDPMPADYDFYADEEWDGPFADYLRKLAHDVGNPDLIDLEPYSHGRVRALPGTPGYRIYTEDLLKVAPLGSDAMYALHVAEAALSEIPEGLKGEDAHDDRSKWLEGKLSAKSRQWLSNRRSILAQIRLVDVGTDATSEEGADQ